MPGMQSANDLRSSAPAERRDDPVFFVADAHFGAGRESEERARIERFLRFLRHVRERARILYIAGDLFDFWFEYAEVLPRVPVLVLRELAELARAGVDVRYLAGNHDYWIGRFFRETIGISVFHRPIDLRLQGKRIYLTHGDDLAAGHDPGYRLLRRIVRNPAAIRAYHWIHPDIGIPLARWASRVSRAHTSRKKFILNRTLEDAVRRKFREGFDCVILGHIHFAEHFRYDEGECVILGDWIEAFTFAEMTGGAITLKRFEE
ncbi:MAG: UDP-2,3-diacylglucosamine diphosphatase [Candidatus Eisenbacteria bacterium]|nr:UDP-2,3-diacylglucosamine diphosphatase [Candidatus Eisenbacteria bacterium]